MSQSPSPSYTAFRGAKRIASGGLTEVAVAAKAALDADRWAQVVIFDDVTSALVEVDFRGTSDDVARRIRERAEGVARDRELAAAEGEARRPGRPRLGVVAREVTLLPRHWEWLAEQPGGASVTLRKLVELARRANRGRDAQRRAREAAYRFLAAMAGNEPGFEEATRALFAGQRERFEELAAPWPADVRDHGKRLAAAAFEDEAAAGGEEEKHV